MSKIVLEPGRADRNYWSDLWRYRELFYFLAWRDVLVRYKQTTIGIAWSVLRPLLTLVVFTVVFGKLGKFPSAGVPYPALVFAGLMPWQFFATSLAEASNSLTANANMLTKVYFPRIIVPSSTVIVSLIDFAISFFIFAGLMAYYQITPSWRILVLPLFLLHALITSLGAGLLFSSLTVKYRDFRFIVPFVVQLGLYISPVGFNSGVVPEKWRFLYSLNPMVGIIDGFRWSLLGLGESSFYVTGYLTSICISFAICYLGVWYFRRTERFFADLI